MFKEGVSEKKGRRKRNKYDIAQCFASKSLGRQSERACQLALSRNYCVAMRELPATPPPPSYTSYYGPN